mmetsp:Transcript_17951/g.25446  ORF Transcript_17951/g.25446 Transcript_17951/m.25446 type:complete len:101 (-) Transcript_17951:419-721(-)
MPHYSEKEHPPHLPPLPPVAPFAPRSFAVDFQGAFYKIFGANLSVPMIVLLPNGHDQSAPATFVFWKHILFPQKVPFPPNSIGAINPFALVCLSSNPVAP